MTSTTTMTPLHSLPQKYNNNNSNLTHSFSHVRRAAAYCSAVVIVKMHNFFSFFFFRGWMTFLLPYFSPLRRFSCCSRHFFASMIYTVCAPFCEAFTFTWNELLMHHHRLCLPALIRSECTNTSSRRAQRCTAMQTTYYISHSWLHFTWFSHVHFGLLVRSLFSLSISSLYACTLSSIDEGALQT